MQKKNPGGWYPKKLSLLLFKVLLPTNNKKILHNIVFPVGILIIV